MHIAMEGYARKPCTIPGFNEFSLGQSNAWCCFLSVCVAESLREE